MRKFWRRLRRQSGVVLIIALILAVFSVPTQAASVQFIGQPSANWSGYADTGSVFRQVEGIIHVPRVSCPTSGAEVLYWVGLDGDLSTSHTVEQDGVGARCTTGPHPTVSYFAWWEMYPSPLVQLSPQILRIAPGNAVIASIKFQSSSGAFTLYLHDETTNQSYSTNQLCYAGLTCPRTSAEWIAERYAINPWQRQFRPLAAWFNYGKPIFNYDETASSYGDRKMRPIAHFKNTPIYMNNKTGQLLATAGLLSDNGQAFGDSWQL